LLPKLCGIPVFIQGMERRTKAGKLKQSYLSKVLFRIFHKKSSNEVPFLNQQHNRDERKLLNAFFVMMLPLNLVGFFYENVKQIQTENFFVNQKCPLNL